MEGLLEEPESEVVKIGHGVGFRPEPDPAAGERAVAYTKEHGLVIQRPDLAPLLHDSELVPPGRWERVVDLLHDLLYPVEYTGRGESFARPGWPSISSSGDHRRHATPVHRRDRPSLPRLNRTR